MHVAIPTPLRIHILEELHSAHAGIVKMKSLARSYVWWPGIDADIERMARECCKNRNNPHKIDVHPWDYALTPWQRLHIDYAGPFHESYFLILVDSYLKWLEVVPTSSTTTRVTINAKHRDIFARFGLLFTAVADNGTNLKSEEFEKFLRGNGITYKVTAPYHPATNGQAERYVQTVKKSLRSQLSEGENIKLSLFRYLMKYRKTPNSNLEGMQSPPNEGRIIAEPVVMNSPWRCSYNWAATTAYNWAASAPNQLEIDVVQTAWHICSGEGNY